MECIMCFLQIVVSIMLPLWVYICFRDRIRKRLSTRNGEECSMPDLIFTLKRWWARWCITKRIPDEDKLYKEHLINTGGIGCFKPHLESLGILTDEKSCSSVSFYATDQKGNAVFVKLAHRRHKITEVFLQLTLSDGRQYVLPECPDSVVVDNISQGWSAIGLRIELLELQKRWRITYNGMLKNRIQDDDEEHIRLNCIFIASGRALEWPNSWSPYLHADALAHEPWRSPDWINTIKKVDYSGYDQWGSIIGQVTFADSSTTELYLRGLFQRRWGKHESWEFHKCVTFLGVTAKGAMYYLGASSTKNGFSHMQFGFIKKSSGAVCKIDSMSLQLNDFWQTKDHPENRVQFTTTSDEYNAVMKSESATIFHSGQPWDWTTEIRNLKLELNGDKGVGLMQLWYPYTGPHRVKISNTKIHFTLQPNTCIHKDDHVLFFDDRKCQNENIVGGKGFSLAVLTSVKNADFIVPRGFCVTIFALDLQLQSHKELQDAIDCIEKISTGKEKGDLTISCEQAVTIIQNTPVIEVVKEAITKAVEELEAPQDENKDDTVNKYAVRSSAVGEDSEETSAAGQNSTFLGIKTNDVVQHVAKCWASLFTYQSVQYRRQNGLPIKASMGVCIQRMVNADAAGVMFTRHPTSGDPTSMIITANYGLGETVVSGTVEPDTLTVHRKEDSILSIKSKTLGKKTEKISMSNDGVSTISLNESDIEKSCIEDQIAIKLAELGVQLESLFGTPRDIEWAVVKDKIYLLQARPITTLNTWTTFELTHELDTGVPADNDIITIANVGEVVPKPLSPLSISTMHKIIDRGVALKYEQYDASYALLTAMKFALNYYSIFLQYVPNTITLALKMSDISICGHVVVTPEVFKTAQERYGIINWCKQYFLLFETIVELWNNSAEVKKAKQLCENLKLDLDKFHTAYSLYNEISKKHKDSFHMALCHNHTSRVSVMSQMFAMLMLTQGYDDLMPDHFTDIALLLSSCSSDVVSKEVPVRLREIVKHIKSSGKAEEFVEIDPVDGINWLKLNCPEAAKLLGNLLNEHGHRGIQELDVGSEPWCLRPEDLVTTIQTLANSPKDNDAAKEISVVETIASLKTPKSSITRWLLKKIVPFCRSSVASREVTKSIYALITHKIRMAYKKLGELMVMEGHLPDKNLIFFLTHYEVEQMLTNQSHNPTFIRKALRRSKLQKQLEKLQYPEFSTGMLMPIKPEFKKTSGDTTKIKGTSVYGGSILARACVIRDLSDAKTIKQGDILITYCTDIGWSPYFPLLSGIVTELGGLISHGAVIAREYGLPCIIGATGATSVFQTGDTVLLVADSGLLELVQRA